MTHELVSGYTGRNLSTDTSDQRSHMNLYQSRQAILEKIWFYHYSFPGSMALGCFWLPVLIKRYRSHIYLMKYGFTHTDRHQETLSVRYFIHLT